MKRRYENGDTSTPKKATRIKVKDWSNTDVIEWLKCERIEQFESYIAARGITGELLLDLSESAIHDIDDFAIDEEDKERLWSAIMKLKSEVTNGPRPADIVMPVERKVFQDAIHGSMDLHPLLIRIIDTPQFQRLRNLKQLGCCFLVYPGAGHHRFEHSLGVCHLAGELLRKLKKNQPELDILERDILCVEIAGLCHDLGHGPFSHMFDGRFIPQLHPGSTWRHEDASAQLFQHLVDSNESVRAAFREFGIGQQDIEFIKEQIQGLPDGTVSRSRPKNKAFLYEVVANKKNGIDVDKWDYFARDCHYLGIRNVFDHLRLMNFVRVIEVNGEPQICTRDKEAETLYDMFHTRRALHKRAYQHRVCIAAELMVCEAFLKANDHMKFYNSKEEAMKLSECIHDPDAYTTLTDHVFYEILYSRDPQLREAREILQRIERRELYKSVGETRPQSTIDKRDLVKYAAEIAGCLSAEQLEGSAPLAPDDIILNLVRLDYGMGHKNPIENVWFYSKSRPDTPIRQRKDQISAMLPETFSEQILVAYCKHTDPEHLEVAERAFRAWCEERQLQPPKSQEMLNMTQS